MSKSLILTLGHNSSAIAVDDGQILGGYEEERFTDRKSDSAFPINSINRLYERFGKSYDDVYVGHWFTAGAITNAKYVDMAFLKDNFGSENIHSLFDGFSHHDSHMLSAKVFADHYNFPKDCLIVVADGFGTFGECISLYESNHLGQRVINRFFGYDKSLGMLYQYATAYLGMKMHNHEYKMLGYEAHLHEALDSSQIVELMSIIHADASERVKALYNNTVHMDLDPIVNVAALAAAQNGINSTLDSVFVRLGLQKSSIPLYHTRVIISAYVQGIVESVMGALIGVQKPTNLLVCGGLFYNVKLNHMLADSVDRFCVMPIAGDQGAGLGVYQAHRGDLKWPGHVFWGHRDLKSVTGSSTLIKCNEDLAYDIIFEQLSNNGLVNIVRGAMEFGPRSLCNTATLAVPTEENVSRINGMNDRTTIMPMAPVITDDQASECLVDIDKIYGSLDYMIVTRNVREEHKSKLRGASHEYKLTGNSTCRPQIIRDETDVVYAAADAFGGLINTSFNYHGVPIAFEGRSIEYSHSMQNRQDKIVTVVIQEN